VKLAPAQVVAHGGSRRFKQWAWQGLDHRSATGRAKDMARILQFVDAGVLDAARLDGIPARHGLASR
jgi:hypothetical protein